MRSFEEIYAAVRPLWPDEYEVVSGRLQLELSAAWDAAEAAVETDTFEDLLVWAMYRVLHRRSMELARDRKRRLVLDSVALEVFEAEFWSCLQEADWPKRIPEYDRGRFA